MSAGGARLLTDGAAAPTCWAPLGEYEAPEDGALCGRPTVAHGLCTRHARRMQRNGTLDIVRRSRVRK